MVSKGLLYGNEVGNYPAGLTRINLFPAKYLTWFITHSRVPRYEQSLVVDGAELQNHDQALRADGDGNPSISSLIYQQVPPEIARFPVTVLLTI